MNDFKLTIPNLYLETQTEFKIELQYLSVYSWRPDVAGGPHTNF